MLTRVCIHAVLALFLIGAAVPVRAVERAPNPGAGTAAGDLDAMLQRGVIRVAAPFSGARTLNDTGRGQGLAAKAIADLKRCLDKEFQGKISVVVIPTAHDRLLASLVEGRADIAAMDRAAREDRPPAVDFIAPLADPMNAIVVTGPGAPALRSLDDLSGREVHVREASSHHLRLNALSSRFVREGKAPVKIAPLPNELQDQDVLVMLNAGLIRITVKDDRLVKLWKPVLPHAAPRPDLALPVNSGFAWAIRKHSPKLKAALDALFPNAPPKDLQRPLSAPSARDALEMHNALNGVYLRRFEALVALFQKYGGESRFNSLMIMALSYHESRLDQNVRSSAGAIGVMQIMPSTARECRMGDVAQVEANIRGGARLMALLVDGYMKDAPADETNRTLFGIACYILDAPKIASARARAKQEGLNPNVWFNNVELIAAKTQGQWPVRYVRDIFKFSVAYKLEQEKNTKPSPVGG